MLDKEWEDSFSIEDMFPDGDDAAVYHREGVYKAADEALAACKDTLGGVNLSWMADFSGLSPEELKEALENVIFQDPEVYDAHPYEDAGWVLRDQYLSGNIMEKLGKAKKLNKKYTGRFESNILALKKALPPRIRFDEIGFCIGSPWIPAYFYADFAKEILELKMCPKISHSETLHQWKVEEPDDAREAIHNICTYGTGRMNALKIMEHSLNAGIPKVYDKVSRPERKSGHAYVLNKEETLAAQEKKVALQEAFRNWVCRNPYRRKYLEKAYYNTCACNYGGRFDGSFLSLPDLNPEVSLYKHQRNAVARIVLEKDVLLNHAVGSGKTYTMIVGIHERKRMGLSEKNLIVVPNQILGEFEAAHHYLYPSDSVLVVYPEDFAPEHRQEVLKKIRDGAFTAVYMAFSSFSLIPLSNSGKLERQQNTVAALDKMAAGSNLRWEQRKLENLAGKMSEKLMDMMTELPEDRGITFEQLGITTLAVDEVHNFKNISLQTHAENIVGMYANGSRKCDEMLEKVRIVREQGGGIIFSTGTPLTNSIADLFVLQTYLQPEQMEMLHLGNFDEWINAFAHCRTGFEIDVDSQNYRIMTRFSSFCNLPELSRIFAGVSDFYYNPEQMEGLPECEGYRDIVVPKSREQEQYIEELVLRTELIRQKLVKGNEDNLLKVTHDGRAAAIDIRLTEPSARPDSTGTKAWACAENVLEIWRNYPGTAQLIFCDLGTPKKGFHIYDELKKYLTDLGIPEQEIAYIHDASTEGRRRKLFQAVNQASVRVLIGSTQKLGTGVNIQERLIAVHHLDVPWKPSDITQREGRMIRHGNRNRKVYRYRYITAGTFDAYSWQILENKQRFIGQFMNGTLAGREMRDVDDVMLTYAEIKALAVGDPLLKSRIETANELDRVKLRYRQREKELFHMAQIVQEHPAGTSAMEQQVKRLVQDQRHFEENREAMTRSEREAFGEELLEAVSANIGRIRERCFDHVHGFRILLPADMKPGSPYVMAEGISGNRYKINLREAKIPGCMQRVEYVLMNLDQRIKAVEERISQVRRQAAQAEKELKKGNPFEAEVSRLSEKLLDMDGELNRRAEERGRR